MPRRLQPLPLLPRLLAPAPAAAVSLVTLTLDQTPGSLIPTLCAPQSLSIAMPYIVSWVSQLLQRKHLGIP